MDIMFGNNALSTLTVSLFSGDTNLIIDAADAAAFPQPTQPNEYFLITIEDLKQTPVLREICRCVGRTGNLFTIVRGQEGFIPLDFTVGTTTVSNRVTAGTMRQAINIWPPADSKVYGTKMINAGGAPTFVEVLTTQGALTFGGPIGVGATPPAGVTVASLTTGDLFINGTIGFNTYWATAWKYRSPGYGAMFTYDIPTGVLATYMSASGAAGANTTGTVGALKINAKGQISGGGVGLPAVDDTRYTWTADNFALEPGGYFAFNTYLAGNTWRTKVAGYSGLMYLDSSGGNLQFFANPTAGAGAATALTLGMQLSPVGSLQVQNFLYATKGVSFSSYNGWEYQAYATSAGDHVLLHRSGWYDVWQGSGGARVWVGANATAMVLDGSGNLTATGVIRSNSNNLWATPDNTLGLYLTGGRWSVLNFWSNGWRLQFDGQTGGLAYVNSSNQVLWSVDGGGNMWVNSNISTNTDLYVRTVVASSTVQAGYIHSTGNMQTDVDNNVSRNVNCAGTVTANVVHATAHVYADQRAIINGDVDASAIYARAGLYSGGYGDTSFGRYRGSGQYVSQFSSNWYWGWETATGNLIWHRNGPNFWVLNAQDGSATNYISYVGGMGAYANFSDRRLKTVGAAVTHGLAEIIQLQPYEFTRLPIPETPAGRSRRGATKEGDVVIDLPPLPLRTEIGFVAQDVQPVIPEAVLVFGGGTDTFEGVSTFSAEDPALAINYDALLAVVVNAIKEINTRLVALEGAP